MLVYRASLKYVLCAPSNIVGFQQSSLLCVPILKQSHLCLQTPTAELRLLWLKLAPLISKHLAYDCVQQAVLILSRILGAATSRIWSDKKGLWQRRSEECVQPIFHIFARNMKNMATER